MASETQPSWPTARLGDLAEKVRSGATPKGGQISYLVEREGHALIRSQNVLDHEFDFEGLAFISEAQAADLRGAEVASDDVLLNITGDGRTFGRACVVPSAVLPACVNQHVMLVRVDRSRLHPHFLASWLALSETKEYIESFNAGGSRRAITKGHIERFEVPLPPFAVQEAIGSLAAVINRRVESLRQANATLEAIAQALFKSWFVDFDPVRAKVEGREPEGMDAATAELFPSDFGESELGLIPRGWKVLPLSEAFEINPRRAIKKGSVAPYLDMASVPTSGHVPAPPVDREFSSGSKFLNGDTLLARITPCLENGKTAHVDFLAHEQVGWGSTEFIVLRPKPPLPLYFGYLIARHDAFRAFAKQAMTGTSGRQRVELGQLERFQVVCPDAHVSTAFGLLVEPIRACISANQQRSEVLAKLRDILLPRLISGKLRLPQAEAVVETLA